MLFPVSVPDGAGARPGAGTPSPAQTCPDGSGVTLVCGATPPPTTTTTKTTPTTTTPTTTHLQQKHLFGNASGSSPEANAFQMPWNRPAAPLRWCPRTRKNTCNSNPLDFLLISTCFDHGGVLSSRVLSSPATPTPDTGALRSR